MEHTPGALEVVGLVAVLGLLAIALYATRRARKDPLARVLAFLAGDLALWNLATVLFHWTGEPAWHWLDVTFSPLTPPLVLHLVLTWVGRARRARAWLALAYAAFVALALSSACAWFAAWAREWLASPAWSVLYLAGWLPIMAASLALLWREVGRQRDLPLVAMRARLMFAAIALAGVLGSTELWDDLFDVPALGVVGSFAAMLLVAAATFRLGLFAARERFASALYVGVFMVVLGVVLSAVAARGNVAATLLAAIVVLAVGLVVVRELVQSAARRRAKTAELASLGRFSAQMAHDLKNPLAAMKGAVQYLEVALPPDGEARPFLELMSAQVARMQVIIERYRRLAEVRPEPVELDPGALASEVARHLAAVRADVALEVHAHDALAAGDAPVFRGDRDLLASAFENIVGNALAAMPNGGRLTVGARLAGDIATIVFEDDGVGIDPRYLDAVGDDFFTTRADGSGLGLAFVRRIAAAHGGTLEVASELGRGTRVTIALVSQRDPDGGGASGGATQEAGHGG